MATTRRDVRPWQDEETLRWARHEKDLTTREIAPLLGCSASTIKNWLNEYNIPEQPWQTEEALRKMLLEGGMSVAEVADHVDRSVSTIRYWLKKLEITPFECPTCSDGFPSEHGMLAHHKRAHGESLAEVVVECAECGSDIRRKRHEVKNNERSFCNFDCRTSFLEDNTGENHPNYIEDKRPCEVCGEIVDRPPSNYKDHVFCSRECYQNWSGRPAGEDHPQYSVKAVECANCGAELELPAHRRKYERNFCDSECMGEWRSENRTGEDHPQWQGGRFPYGDGWDREKRRQVRARDDFSCQSCGMSQETHIDQYGTKLCVHHIIPAREVDSAKRRNSMDNLVTLCRPCHKRWEGIPLRPELAN